MIPQLTYSTANGNLRRAKLVATLMAAVLVATFFAEAQSWTPQNFKSYPLNSVAASADGTKLIAVGSYTPLVFTSTNSGITWISNNVTGNAADSAWKSCASSANGQTLMVGGAVGGLYISTNAGAGWFQASPTNFWTSVASSADGTKLVAVSAGADQEGGLIYISTNSGIDWQTNNSPFSVWACVASSADGNRLIAAAAGQYFGASDIFVTTNAGKAWFQKNTPSNSWDTVSCSADGMTVIVGSGGATNAAILSTNGLSTWETNTFPVFLVTATAVSADGTHLLAAEQNGPIYTSDDSGMTWSSNAIPQYAWFGAAFSADGSLKVAVNAGGYRYPSIDSFIYTSYSTPQPKPGLAAGGSNCLLNWTVPATNFSVQESSDLISWSAVTNAPILNLNNLQNQLVLPAAGNQAFYRLSNP
jgi:hypothetical protein